MKTRFPSLGLSLLFSTSIFATTPGELCAHNDPSSVRNVPTSIDVIRDRVEITAGCLRRTVEFAPSGSEKTVLSVNGIPVAEASGASFSFSLGRAVPNEAPLGLPIGNAEAVEQENSVADNSDALKVSEKKNSLVQNVDFPNRLMVSPEQLESMWGTLRVGKASMTATGRSIELTRTVERNDELRGLTVTRRFETYDGYEAIRQTLTVTNGSQRWICLRSLLTETLNPLDGYTHTQPLSPADKGVLSSVVGVGNNDFSRGVIAVSEAPSALRQMTPDMQMGYRPDYFEWVLGPGESFTADPTLFYGYEGKSYATSSALSTALDRCVEGRYASFLVDRIVRPSHQAAALMPVFCTWTNYNSDIRQDNMGQAVDRAAEMGFGCFQLDAGWCDTNGRNDWAVVTVDFDKSRFPDPPSFIGRVGAAGMKLGQWYSVFRSPQLLDMGSPASGFSYPLVKRGGGVGMSFASGWKRQYADEIVTLHRTYGTQYLKQDLTNLYYGDIAAGHESRTLRESLLRSIRGLFASQAMVHEQAPDMVLQLSHEIYWKTPGPPADVAVLKYADVYHATPNEYWGAGNRKTIVSDSWNYRPDSLGLQLLKGAFRARQNWYSHRGLPLYKIEVFGAATTCYRGSLTPQIADRQVCSWLMGAPTSFSGDLGSLTPELVALYRDRFAKIKALQQRYGIYFHFQYSGVPAPTDTGWHWWGKLNDRHEGAVVVLRGTEGAASQPINIPWADPSALYEVKGLLGNRSYGTFRGSDLIAGKLTLSLPTLGQEILELKTKNL